MELIINPDDYAQAMPIIYKALFKHSMIGGIDTINGTLIKMIGTAKGKKLALKRLDKAGIIWIRNPLLKFEGQKAGIEEATVTITANFGQDNRVYTKAKLIPTTTHHIECPSCSGRLGNIDHLINDKADRSFGPWYCDDCGVGYFGKITAQGEVTLAPSGVIQEKTLVQLRLPGTDIVIWVEGMAWSDRGAEKYDNEYYYNEHTCPTNYLQRIDKIFKGNDDDPHGVFEYLKTIPWVDSDKVDLGQYNDNIIWINNPKPKELADGT